MDGAAPVQADQVEIPLDRVTRRKLFFQTEKTDFVAVATAGVTFEEPSPVVALPD